MRACEDQPSAIAENPSLRSAAERLDAHLLTARGLSAALLGLPRVAQEVHLVRSVFGGHALSGDLREPRYLVLVVAESRDRGSYYQVRKRTLDLLRDGLSPDDLELEPVGADDAEETEEL